MQLITNFPVECQYCRSVVNPYRDSDTGELLLAPHAKSATGIMFEGDPQQCYGTSLPVHKNTWPKNYDYPRYQHNFNQFMLWEGSDGYVSLRYQDRQRSDWSEPQQTVCKNPLEVAKYLRLLFGEETPIHMVV